MSSARDRVEALREQIARHNEAYYALDAPTIPDADYDALVVELRELEGEYPELATDESVTQKVGTGSTTVFSEVTHAEPMLSLDNVFDVHELAAWAQRAAKGLGVPASTLEFAVEPKIDGLALSITYVDGALVQGATRGDGRVGEDVTENVRTIKNLPQQLRNGHRGRVEVRGEVLSPRRTFSRSTSDSANSAPRSSPIPATPRRAAFVRRTPPCRVPGRSRSSAINSSTSMVHSPSVLTSRPFRNWHAGAFSPRTRLSSSPATWPWSSAVTGSKSIVTT